MSPPAPNQFGYELAGTSSHLAAMRLVETTAGAERS